MFWRGAVIKVENLSKSFGSKRAVDGVSFEVGKGEVLGFLGPNGAGKSTTMRMITGFIPPSAGAASVCGLDVQENPIEVKRRIGYLPEAAPSYTEMSVLSFLRFAAEMRGCGARHCAARYAASSSCAIWRTCSGRRSIRFRRASATAPASRRR